MNDTLTWIQNWYKNRSNGEWEHAYGIKIDTLDNPGWSVEIDLLDTGLSTSEIIIASYENNDNDWIECSIKDRKYCGYGGPLKLEELLKVFKDWVGSFDPDAQNK